MVVATSIRKCPKCGTKLEPYGDLSLRCPECKVILVK